MKLPIKKKYFDKIKSGEKVIEYRDAHLTFVCEETGELLSKDIIKVELLKGTNKVFPDVLKDDTTVCFYLDNLQGAKKE